MKAVEWTPPKDRDWPYIRVAGQNYVAGETTVVTNEVAGKLDGLDADRYGKFSVKDATKKQLAESKQSAGADGESDDVDTGGPGGSGAPTSDPSGTDTTQAETGPTG